MAIEEKPLKSLLKLMWLPCHWWGPRKAVSGLRMREEDPLARENQRYFQ